MKKEIKDLLDAFACDSKNPELRDEILKCVDSFMDFSDLQEISASECALDIAEKILGALPKKVSLKYILVVLTIASSVIIDGFLDEHHDGAEGREYIVFGKLMASEIFCKLLRTAITHLIEQSENE